MHCLPPSQLMRDRETGASCTAPTERWASGTHGLVVLPAARDTAATLRDSAAACLGDRQLCNSRRTDGRADSSTCCRVLRAAPGYCDGGCVMGTARWQRWLACTAAAL